jgi:hypothetical protein
MSYEIVEHTSGYISYRSVNDESPGAQAGSKESCHDGFAAEREERPSDEGYDEHSPIAETH